MSKDLQTYSRAVAVAGLGLVLQAAMSVALLLYGKFAHDAASWTAAAYSGFGLIAWTMTLVVYDQHRRERRAAMEDEALESDLAHGASVFEGGANTSLAASRRLAGVYKWFVPAVSLVLGGGLIAFGLWRFPAAQALAEPGNTHPATLRGWALAVGLFCAFAGFVFARYVAGMAVRAAWSNLRAGSSFAIGTALFGLASAVGQFADVAGTDSIRRLLPVILASAMVLLGAEILLNFVAELYRPRRKGELPRPAVDSRLLGFFAAPDQAARSMGELLDYQIGYSVQGSWFYRLMARWWAGLVLVVVAIVWGLSALAVLQPHERGMVLRFGEIVREDIGPGLHLKMPWPIDRVVVPASLETDPVTNKVHEEHTTTGVRTAELGTAGPDAGDSAILWTTSHARNEVFNIVQPSKSQDHVGVNSLTLVAVEVPMQYVVEDPLLYEELGPVGVRDEMIQAVGRRAVTRYLSHLSIDDILGAGRADLAAQLETELRAAINGLNPDANGKPRGAGIRILSVSIEGVHPPKQVAPKFEQVVIAQTNRESMIEDARKDEVGSLASVVGNVDSAREIVKLIDELEAMQARGQSSEEIEAKEQAITRSIGRASGQAAELLAQARADRWRKHMQDRAALVDYQGQIMALRAAPGYFVATHYFDALAEVFDSSRIFVVPDRASADSLVTQIDLSESRSGAEIFDPGSLDE